MKIVSLHFEIVRATPAVAEFLVCVRLDEKTSGCEVIGRAIGPRAPGFTTVEVSYPLHVVESSDTAVSLRCVIPEPNLWTPDAPFAYAVEVELSVNGERLDSRSDLLAFRRP